RNLARPFRNGRHARGARCGHGGSGGGRGHARRHDLWVRCRGRFHQYRYRHSPHPAGMGGWRRRGGPSHRQLDRQDRVPAHGLRLVHDHPRAEVECDGSRDVHVSHHRQSRAGRDQLQIRSDHGAGRCLLVARTKIEPTFVESLMRKTLTALIALATVASSSAVPIPADAREGRRTVGAREWPAHAPPGDVNYPYGEYLPGSNCSWYRMPVYDAYGNMVGWRGRPVAFCYWLSGYRSWP